MPAVQAQTGIVSPGYMAVSTLGSCADCCEILALRRGVKMLASADRSSEQQRFLKIAHERAPYFLILITPCRIP